MVNFISPYGSKTDITQKSRQSSIHAIKHMKKFKTS